MLEICTGHQWISGELPAYN